MARTHAARLALPHFLKFSVPDALWCYALVAHIGRLWRGSRRGWIWILFTVAAALFSELGQLAGVVPGTFDLSDLFAITFASALALLSLCIQWRRPAWTAPVTS
jgi:hypothetical protein